MTRTDLELTLSFEATKVLPATAISYRADAGSQNIREVMIKVGDAEYTTGTDAALPELAFRYRQKRVSNATLIVDDVHYADTDGDGRLDFRDGQQLREKPPAWQVVIERIGGDPTQTADIAQMQWLAEIMPVLTGKQAMERAFVASCGSKASVVHEMRSHSILWAAIPSGATPNEVHRHLGGNVYCLFYSGGGHLHKVDPANGFETVLIEVDNVSPFQLLTLPVHSWYQPINTATTNLLYFMIHEPAFDRSELLTLKKQDSRADWRFEYA